MSTLSISAIQNTQIIMLHVDSVGTTSACDLASIFACPQCGISSVYEISMVGAHNRTNQIFFCASPPTWPTCKSRILTIINFPVFLKLLVEKIISCFKSQPANKEFVFWPLVEFSRFYFSYIRRGLCFLACLGVYQSFHRFSTVISFSIAGVILMLVAVRGHLRRSRGRLLLLIKAGRGLPVQRDL